jgi:NAD(P)-dependent dehydrogenase (short-subunit alcohol dehydrogenase family)
MRLAGKVAIVTGAAAGIGRATAELFAREGARVTVADRDGEGARAVAQGLGEAGLGLMVDVAAEAEVRAMVERTMERFGRVDVLVNNAGYGLIGTVATTSEADWDALMAVNVKGVFLCSKHAIPVMERQGGGVIIHTASNVASVGIKDRAAYVASKGAVAALTRAMAIDHAAANIRVNCVAPGPIASSYFEKMKAQVEDPVAFEKGLAARQPINRMGQPEEIATMMLWLASDESSFATGATFTVDGGMSAW